MWTRTSLFLCLALPLVQEPTVDRASALLRGGHTAKAVAMLERVVERDPGNGEAWYSLGTACHALASWERAAEANLRAATFPTHRDTAFYNAACALSLAGRVDEAARALERSIEVGFVDYDLMASDPDLVALRAKQPLDLPSAGSFEVLKARNGVEMRYRILTKGDAKAARGRPALVCFAPGSGPLATEWMIRNLFAGAGEQEDWTVIALVAPQRGWSTHPSHHALEELLGEIQSDYAPAGGKFHLFGTLHGCRAAFTYLSMSSRFFQTVTMASFTGWPGYVEKDRIDRRKLHLIAGEADVGGLEVNRRAAAEFQALGIPCSLTTVPGGSATLAGWGENQLLSDLSAHLLAP